MSISLPDCDVSQQFYRERKHIASDRAKNLKCCECRELIEKGEPYCRCTGMWDDDLWSGAQHIYCWLFARSMNGHDSTSFRSTWLGKPPALTPGFGINAGGINDGYGGCVPFEGLSEFLSEMSEDFEDEGLTHDPDRFWKSMRSGCKEKFSNGSGI